jgi:4-carboxymuconolactone decarboxylase
VTDDARARGEKTRRAVLGNAHVDASQAKANAYSSDFVDYITENIWGDVWSRPGLELKTRSMIVIAVTAALGRLDELELHLRGSLNTGLSRDEIKELLLQVGAYAGAPAANSAFKIAARIFAEADAKVTP